MKAVVRSQYGSPDVVRIEEVPKPVPADDEVLVKVVAASINGSDREAIAGRPAYSRIAGLRKPRYPVLGSDIAGIIQAVGKQVRDLRPGDEVLGEVPGYHGGFAEYACATGRTLVPKPPGLTFEEAAAIPQGGAIAFLGIRTKGRVERGQKVLINGAAGAAGCFAVQLARLHGAEVTAVDHGDKHAFLRSLGADHVVDYTREDFTRKGTRYDLILDPIASRSPGAIARALATGGRYFMAGGEVRVMLAALLAGPFIELATRKRIRILVVPQERATLLAVTELCATRQIVPPIDRCYQLADAREALRYVSEGSQLGKVIITM
jgi:NADPH:quinone reductase-like Zn-dependent oxidoreductase